MNASIEAARAGDAKGRFCRFGYGSYDTQQQTASAEIVLTTCHHLSEEAQVVADNAEHLSDAGKELDTISHELKEQMEQFTV